jgi:hypothetical protein
MGASAHSRSHSRHMAANELASCATTSARYCFEGTPCRACDKQPSYGLLCSVGQQHAAVADRADANRQCRTSTRGQARVVLGGRRGARAASRVASMHGGSAARTHLLEGLPGSMLQGSQVSTKLPDKWLGVQPAACALRCDLAGPPSTRCSCNEGYGAIGMPRQGHSGWLWPRLLAIQSGIWHPLQLGTLGRVGQVFINTKQSFCCSFGVAGGVRAGELAAAGAQIWRARPTRPATREAPRCTQTKRDH